MKKKIVSVILAAAITFAFSASVFAEGTAKDVGTETKETSETAAEEKKEDSKSGHLLAAGYELMEGVTIPVETDNKTLGIEG